MGITGVPVISGELQVDSWLQRLVYLLTSNSELSNSILFIDEVCSQTPSRTSLLFPNNLFYPMHVPTLPRELCDWSCICLTFFSVLHLYAFPHFPADLLFLHRFLRFFSLCVWPFVFILMQLHWVTRRWLLVLHCTWTFKEKL